MPQDNNWNDNDVRFVLYLDIMGFKDRVAKTSVNELKESLLAFKTKNRKLKPLLENTTGGSKKEYLKIAQFSDSIVVISKNNTIVDLNRITKAAVILMQTALETGFALRGAIASGNMVFDSDNQVFFGQALVDAYLLEEQLCFYGVVFHDSAEKLVVDSLENNPGDIYFPIKDEPVSTKAGLSSHYHISWYEVKKNLSEGNIRSNANVWLKKLRESVSGTPRVYLDNTLKIVNRQVEP